MISRNCTYYLLLGQSHYPLPAQITFLQFHLLTKIALRCLLREVKFKDVLNHSRFWSARIILSVRITAVNFFLDIVLSYKKKKKKKNRSNLKKNRERKRKKKRKNLIFLESKRRIRSKRRISRRGRKGGRKSRRRKKRSKRTN